MNKPDHTQAAYVTETGEAQRRVLETCCPYHRSGGPQTLMCGEDAYIGWRPAPVEELTEREESLLTDHC